MDEDPGTEGQVRYHHGSPVAVNGPEDDVVDVAVIPYLVVHVIPHRAP
jgi:hypothetical protein